MSDTPIIPANIQLNSALAIFHNIDVRPDRTYYRSDSPTSLSGIAKSHFKGIAAYGGKLIFTHTDLDIVSTRNGKYLVANKTSGQGSVDFIGSTLHEGWPHPCSAQACGSYMAMGIQAAADGAGSQVSEIQILDIRAAQVNQPVHLLGTISRPSDGINGVGMTKEAGPDGKYIVAGVNSSRLTIYKSDSSSLTPFPAFHQIFHTDTFAESGAGVALVTQTDGKIFLFTMNDDDSGGNSQIALYQVDLSGVPNIVRLGLISAPIPGMSESVALLQKFEKVLPGALGSLASQYTGSYLNSSFRWGKGLAITSADTVQLYATDRNVLPLSSIPVVGSDKDFSVVTWNSSTKKWPSSGICALHQGNADPSQLWADVNDGHSWMSDYHIPSVSIGGTPAAVMYGNQLFVFFVQAYTHSLFYKSFDGMSWGLSTQVPNTAGMDNSPSVAVFGDRLYAFYLRKDTHSLFYKVYNGEWGPETQMPNTAGMGNSPSVAVLNNKLYAFYVRNNTNSLFYNVFDGTHWANETQIPNTAGMGYSPSVVAFNNKLYAFYVRTNTNNVWYNVYDGTHWGSEVEMPNTRGTSSAPGAGVFNGKLYVYFLLLNSHSMYYKTFDGHTWGNETQVANTAGMNGSPSAAAFHFPQIA